MGIEVSSTRAICSKCGKAYSRYKGFFPVSYAVQHKGIGHAPVCKECIDNMYNSYLAQCNNAQDAVRQMCRKLDLYWSENVFRQVEKKSTTRSMMTQYMSKINSVTYAGKSYDDTLSEEGTLWCFAKSATKKDTDNIETNINLENASDEDIDIPDEVVAFWGPGYMPSMYAALEQRRKHWMSRLPKDIEIDIGTEAIIRQICSLELDINRDRAKGRSVDRNVNALNTLLGSACLKPAQKKIDDTDASYTSTPMGVWLYKYEHLKPLPEIDDDLKDVNGTKKYIFTWMGHLCKMLGIKKGYTRLYEEEIERLRVERPEYASEDDETLLYDVFTEDNSENGGNGGDDT